MSAHGPDVSGIVAGTPRTLPSQVKMVAIAGVAVGVAAAAFGLMTSPERTMASFIANFLYFFGITNGAVIFSVALMLTQGRWARPFKRIAESFAVFSPVLYVLLLVMLAAGGMDIYPWTHEEMPAHKAIYLTKGFFFARQVVGLGLLVLLTLLYLRSSLRPDLGAAREKLGDKAPAWWGRLLGDWKGVREETELSIQRQMRIAPVVAFMFASVFTVMAVDLSMSLSPHWFANMFPAWYFMSCFSSGVVFTGMTGQLAKRWLGMEHILTGKLYHDLGKLNFGLCMFWGYTLFAQYLAIWYGNMDEEIGFVLVRTVLEPWNGLAKVVLLTCFLIPWGMLTSRGLKKIRSGYLSAVGVLAVGLWLERHWVVMPSVWKETSLPIGPVEIGMGLGLLSAMVLVVGKFLAEVPPIPITDPWMAPNPADVHVHPSSGTHGSSEAHGH